jgi:hypothetical protein
MSHVKWNDNKHSFCSQLNNAVQKAQNIADASLCGNKIIGDSTRAYSLVKESATEASSVPSKILKHAYDTQILSSVEEIYPEELHAVPSIFEQDSDDAVSIAWESDESDESEANDSSFISIQADDNICFIAEYVFCSQCLRPCM